MSNAKNFSAFVAAMTSDRRWLWLLILSPIAFFLPALPIDETRYLAVAWEMRVHGDYLVPHLNGHWYSDKPPLLFWLINVAWTIFGVNTWPVRLGILLASFGSLALFERLVLRLDADALAARRAVYIFMGMIYFALFASAIMFDVILTTWVLLALHGAVDLDQRRWKRGIALLAIGFGIGILTKGPVVLLDAGTAVLFGPLWSETARASKGKWYGSLVVGIVGGAIIGLAWAIPAAISGGSDYSNAIFFHQTVDRLSSSFAHRRPFWFYLMILPFMVLPWTISIRARWVAWRESFHISKSIRFAVAWAVPTFLAFCLVSGKQPHYLLPILSALAIYLAAVLGREGAHVSGAWFGVLLIVAGIGVAVLPIVAGDADHIEFVQSMIAKKSVTPGLVHVISQLWLAWGIAIALMGCVVSFWQRARRSVLALALSCAATASIAALALAQSTGSTIDVTPAAERIKQMQAEGKPIVHLSWHHGLFEFVGRMTQPLPTVSLEELHAWCVAHPDGEIVTFYTKYPIAAKPEMEYPYRFGRIIFWRASDIIPLKLVPGEKSEDDETPDD